MRWSPAAVPSSTFARSVLVGHRNERRRVDDACCIELAVEPRNDAPSYLTYRVSYRRLRYASYVRRHADRLFGTALAG
jgi:hypothetical protein